MNNDFMSHCCHADVYPSYSLGLDNKSHIKQTYKGYRCMKCGHHCIAVDRKENHSKIR